MKKTTAAKRLNDAKRMLRVYRTQLFARHASEPLKTPPVFLLDLATQIVERTAKELKK